MPCEDADQTLEVHQALWLLLQAHAGLQRIYELEVACSEVLYRIERHGVLIDARCWRSKAMNWASASCSWKRGLRPGGPALQPGQPKQLARFFRQAGYAGGEKLPLARAAPTKKCWKSWPKTTHCPPSCWSTAPSKLKGTYTDKLGALALNAHWRVHTHYAQAVAVTGRLSSNEPIAKHSGAHSRRAARARGFCGRARAVIASADYSQIELRIMAHLSGDVALLRRLPARARRAPRHRCRGVWRGAARRDQRAAPLCQNHQFRPHLRHGQLWFWPKVWASTTRRRKLHPALFRALPGVLRYMEDTKARAKSWAMWRRCWPPPGAAEINAANGPRRAAERAAINAPMQRRRPTIKMAMCALCRRAWTPKPHLDGCMVPTNWCSSCCRDDGLAAAAKFRALIGRGGDAEVRDERPCCRNGWANCGPFHGRVVELRAAEVARTEKAPRTRAVAGSPCDALA